MVFRDEWGELRWQRCLLAMATVGAVVMAMVPPLAWVDAIVSARCAAASGCEYWIDALMSYLSLPEFAALFAAAVLSCHILVRVHIRTRGESSPLALGGFVVAGPLLGSLIAFSYALEEGEKRISGSYKDRQDWISDGEIAGFVAGMSVVGLVAAAVVASLVFLARRSYYPKE
jgi:hypothetical protein